MNKEFETYCPILKLLCERLEEKHKQYGLSYLDRDYEWLRRRLQGELDELDDELFSPHLSGDFVIRESLDVAICALLIADKKRREDTTQIFYDALEERDRKKGVVNMVLTSFEDQSPF